MTGFNFERRRVDGIKTVSGTSPGVRDVAIVINVGGSAFVEHPDSIMLVVRTILLSIGRIYRYVKNIVLDVGDCLITLVDNGEPTPTAGSILANYFLTQFNDESVPQPPNRMFLQHVFNSNLILEALPEIKRYEKMPTYSDNFELVQPGFDPESGVMVHGETITPIPFTPAEDTTLPIQERVPPIIREMLVDFPFATELDYLKTIALFLIGLLASLFTTTGRPLGLFDGNQPGIGKTLLASILGVILDGSVPCVTEFSSSNEELSKRILATLRSNEQRVILIDNARADTGGIINSTSLEAMAVAETLSFRILGSSKNHVQSNYITWLLSMNGMRTTPDLAQRSILIRLAYEGPASLRGYHHNDLVAFVKAHRAEIIATLYGMIEYWKSQGMPDGTATHRFNNMARIISGILDTCGLPGFLSDHQETVQAINTTADDLTALFEAVVDSVGDVPTLQTATSFKVPNEAISSSTLISEVIASGIAADELAMAKSDRAKATKIGQVFSRLLNTPFPVEVEGRCGTATFVKVQLRHNRVGYQFQIELEPSPAMDGLESGSQSVTDVEPDCPF